MNKSSKPKNAKTSTQSIYVGGNVTNSIIIMGENNLVLTHGFENDFEEFPLPKLSKTYVNRKDLEHVIMKYLDEPTQIITLSGMPGSGKSTIAAAIVNNLEHAECKAYWIDVRELNKWDTVLLRKLISNLLENKIVVFDNVDTEKDLSNILLLLDHLESGNKIIITTRSKDMANRIKNKYLGENQEITVMKKSESRMLLSNLLSLDSRDEKTDVLLDEINERLGHHPLAIELYSSNIVNYPGNIYIKLETAIGRLREDNLTINLASGGFEKNLYLLFERYSWNLLNYQDKLSFALCSIFKSGLIDRNIFEECKLEQNFNGKKSLDNLVSKSLLSFDEESGSQYRIHPLLQSFASEKLKAAYKNESTDFRIKVIKAYKKAILDSNPASLDLGSLFSTVVESLTILKNEDLLVDFCGSNSYSIAITGVNALLKLDTDTQGYFLTSVISKLKKLKSLESKRSLLWYAYQTSSNKSLDIFLHVLKNRNLFLGTEVARYIALKVNNVPNATQLITDFLSKSLSLRFLIQTKLLSLIVAADMIFQVLSISDNNSMRKTISNFAWDYWARRLLYYFLKIMPHWILHPLIENILPLFAVITERVISAEFRGKRFLDVFEMTPEEKKEVSKVIKLLDRRACSLQTQDCKNIILLLQSRNVYLNYVGKIASVVHGYNNFEVIQPVCRQLLDNRRKEAIWISDLKNPNNSSLVFERQIMNIVDHLIRIGSHDKKMIAFIEALNKEFEPKGLSLNFELELLYRATNDQEKLLDLHHTFDKELINGNMQAINVYINRLVRVAYYYPKEVLEFIKDQSVWGKPDLFTSLAGLLVTTRLIYPNIAEPLIKRFVDLNLISTDLGHKMHEFEQQQYSLFSDYVMLSQTALLTKSIIKNRVFGQLIIGVIALVPLTSPKQFVASVLKLLLERLQDPGFYTDIWIMDE